MSTLSPSLQFDFKSIVNEKLKDHSGNGYDGTIITGCTIVNDPVMGNCMQFDGTSGYVSLPALTGEGATDFSNGITIATWVNAGSLNNSNIIDLFTGDVADKENLALTYGNGYPYFYSYPLQKGINITTLLGKGNWHHLAVTLAPTGAAYFYIDGVPTTETVIFSEITIQNPVFSLNSIGKGQGGDAGMAKFMGRLAWLSVYNTVLTIDQVNADMLQGESNRNASFRQSFPVDFRVYSDNNSDQVPVLYIEQEGKGKNLYLEITNNSSKPLNIPQETGPATETNYQFQLQFRPGTLSDNFIKKTLTSSNWSIAVGSDQISGTDYISFLRTGDSIPLLAQNESHKIEIDGVNASAMGGARNTNVEFNYKLGTHLSGSRLQSLSIVNHLGQKNIPLHVDVVGPPVILNDGSTPNELLFRIENIGDESLPLSKSLTAGKTKFEVGVLVQPTGELMEWAMVKQADVNSLELDWPILGVIKVASKTSASTTTTITLKEPTSKKLFANTQINIQPPTGSLFSVVLANDVEAGKYQLTLNSTVTDKDIPQNSVLSLANNLGIATATTNSTNITLSNPIDVTIANGALLTISPPSDFSVILLSACKTGDSTLSIKESLSIPEGDVVSLITEIGRIKAATSNTTTITLSSAPTVSVDSGQTLIITPPSGNEISITLAAASTSESILTIRDATSIPEGSIVSLVTQLGTVKETTSDSTTITLLSTVTLPTGVLASKDALLIISPPSSAEISATVSADCAAGTSTLTITEAQSIPEGSIVSLASAENLWNITEKSQIAESITGLLEWTITNQSISDLSSGGSIEFLLKGIVCALPAGQTFVTIHYYNIPGYWDGKFIVPIQKNPLVSQGQNVGINLLPSQRAFLNIPFPVGSLAEGGINNGLIIGDASKCNNKYGGLAISVKDGVKASAMVVVNETDQVFQIKQDGSVKAQSLTTKGDINTGIGTIKTTSLTTTGDINTGAGNIATAQLTTSGKVGIGTIGAPFSPLHINTAGDPGDTANTNMSQGLLIANGTGGGAINMGLSATGYGWIQTAFVNNPQIALELALNPKGGNVGIGISDPYADLHVSIPSSPPSTSDNMVNGLLVSNGAGLGVNIGAVTSPTNNTQGYGWIQCGYANDAGQHNDLALNPQGGNVGIGTTTPLAGLHVITTANSGAVTGTHQSYFDGGSAFVGSDILRVWGSATGTLNPVAIMAGDSIVATRFIATQAAYSTASDIRIKQHIESLPQSESLRQLIRIRLVKHQYQDYVKNGDRRSIGVIAQEVEKILPESVSLIAEFIPNIFAVTSKVAVNKDTHTLSVQLDKPHDLKVDEEVKLVLDKGEEFKRVSRIIDEHTFEVEDWKEEITRLFVYGKKIDDFRTVDYNQIAMLGVSAIQALNSEIEELKKENLSLKTQLDTEMKSMKDELDALKKLITDKA